jgi:hypothetical protein
MTGRATLGRSLWKVAFLATFAGLGAWMGTLIGSGWGSTGLSSFVNAAIALSLSILILVVLTVTALLVGWKRSDRFAAMRPMILAGGLFLGAIGAGWAIARAFAPPLPVVLEGRGLISLELAGLDGYSVQADALAACRSEANSEAVAAIQADSAGLVGAGSVIAMVFMPQGAGAAVEVQVWVRPAGEGQPAEVGWSGFAETVDGESGALRGQVAFSELVLHPDVSGVQPVGWPTNLAGTLRWSCAGWSR